MSVESVDSEAADLPESEDVGCHEFLLKGPDAKTHPFELALQLAEYLDGKPETAATFQPVDVIGHRAIRNLDDRVLHLLGSWKVPDYYTKNVNKGVKWVNPNYRDRGRYSDAATRCECGALMTRTEKVRNSSLLDGENEHTDRCRKSWRLRAQARIYEKRSEIAHEMVALGHDFHTIARRLGLSKDAEDYLDRDSDESVRHKDRARQRIANTAAELFREFKPKEVGRVYGFAGRDGIAQLVNARTDHTTGELAKRRRESEREAVKEEKLADVRRVAERLGCGDQLTTGQYTEHGQWWATTVLDKFDCGWQGILERAGVA